MRSQRIDEIGSWTANFALQREVVPAIAAITALGTRVVKRRHVPAMQFERVLREVKTRYVVGLTATPSAVTGTSRLRRCSSARCASKSPPNRRSPRDRSNTGW